MNYMCLSYDLYLKMKLNDVFKVKHFLNISKGYSPRYSISGEFLEISEIIHAIRIEP